MAKDVKGAEAFLGGGGGECPPLPLLNAALLLLLHYSLFALRALLIPS